VLDPKIHNTRSHLGRPPPQEKCTTAMSGPPPRRPEDAVAPPAVIAVEEEVETSQPLAAPAGVTPHISVDTEV
jgi:hypothetical protein